MTRPISRHRTAVTDSHKSPMISSGIIEALLRSAWTLKLGRLLVTASPDSSSPGHLRGQPNANCRRKNYAPLPEGRPPARETERRLSTIESIGTTGRGCLTTPHPRPARWPPCSSATVRRQVTAGGAAGGRSPPARAQGPAPGHASSGHRSRASPAATRGCAGFPAAHAGAAARSTCTSCCGIHTLRPVRAGGWSPTGSPASEA